MTITFMKELMQWYKDQKKLHRKCAYQVPRLSGAHRPWPGRRPVLAAEAATQRRRQQELSTC